MKLLLFFLLSYTLLYATTPKKFSVIIHKPFDAALFDITEDYDRTISAAGFSNEFKGSSAPQESYSNAFDYLESRSSKYGAQMTLVKVNDNAQVILSKVAKLSRFNKAVALVKTPTNGYFIGGYTLDGSLLVAKLDANANLLYSKIFGTKNYDRMNNLVLLSDGGVLAVGSSFTSRDTHDAMFATGLGNNDIFLTRFSKDGQILWSKKYGTAYDDQGIDAVEAADGSIIVVSTMASEKKRDVNFMRITENGNKVWLNHFITQTTQHNLVVPKKIIRLRDNSFVVALIQYNQVQKEHIRLVKFDLYQNILQDREIQTTYPSGLNDIKEFSNGTLMGVGYVKDKHNTDGLAMLLDSDLTLLRQEHYGGENFDIFYALTILHNSQVAVAGVHTDNNSQEKNMWIVKLNKDTSLATIHTQKAQNNYTKKTTNTSLYKQLKKLFAKEIAAGKLRISPDLTFEFTDPSLYFHQGSYKLNAKQKKFLSRFSSKLFDALKPYENRIKAIEINGHTSSEWGKKSFEQRYLNNAKLSMQRSFSVWSYIFSQQRDATQKWLSKITKGSGYSFSKRVQRAGQEDKNASRRVTLRVVL